MFYFPLFTCTNINSQKRNFSIRMRMYACGGVCRCPDLVIMTALCTVSGESIVPLSPALTHLASDESPDHGHWTPPGPVLIFYSTFYKLRLYDA